LQLYEDFDVRLHLWREVYVIYLVLRKLER
jgi:hypothetical protein